MGDIRQPSTTGLSLSRLAGVKRSPLRTLRTNGTGIQKARFRCRALASHPLNTLFWLMCL